MKLKKLQPNLAHFNLLIDRSFVEPILLGPIGNVDNCSVSRSLMLESVERFVEVLETVVFVHGCNSVMRRKLEHLCNVLYASHV